MFYLNLAVEFLKRSNERHQVVVLLLVLFLRARCHPFLAFTGRAHAHRQTYYHPMTQQHSLSLSVYC